MRGNFRLLISNRNSKTQYLFAICHFSSLRSWFLAQHSLMNWLPWQQRMVYLPSFNFRNFYIYLLKSDISLVKISSTVFEIFSKNAQQSAIFSAVSFWWRHKINMTMTSSKQFCQFVKFSTHSIPSPSFILFWLEIAKLGGWVGGGGGKVLPPSLFSLAKSSVQIGLSMKMSCFHLLTVAVVPSCRAYSKREASSVFEKLNSLGWDSHYIKFLAKQLKNEKWNTF